MPRRYPIVERAVVDAQLLSDPALASGIRGSASKILQEDRGDKSQMGSYVPRRIKVG